MSLGAIDTLLKGIRQIEQRLAALGRGETVRAPSDEVLAALDALELSGGVATPVPSPPAALTLDPALREALTVGRPIEAADGDR